MDGLLKKCIACLLAAVLLFGGGYYMGSRTNVYHDGDGADRTRNDIQSAQDAAGRAEESLNDAAESNRNAQDTAENIGDTNQQLQNSVEDSAGEIERGQQILSGIRQRGQTGTTAP